MSDQQDEFAGSSGNQAELPPDATVITGREVRPGHDGSAAIRVANQPSGRAVTAEIGQLLEGSMLGPYRLDGFIGGGGMGAVFRALDTTLDRTVAVKVLARQQSDDEETLRRFRNEAQSAARLDHENIGRVHAVGSDGEWHYIVFEYIEGTNIRDLVRQQGPFDPARTIDIAIQVADALEHASRREVVHRDIKPSNIVITPAGRPRVVDMGLARLHQVAGDDDLTMSGMTLGTFDYISPEQARDPRAADVRSDLYSLGCTIFFMLVGRPPFAQGTMVQKLLQHQQTQPPALDDLRSDVSRRLAAIIERLMAKDPLDRYQRPAILVADLMACAEAEGISLTVGRPVGAAELVSRPAASWMAWGVPVLLLGVLLAGLWWRSARSRRGEGVWGNGRQRVAPADEFGGGLPPER
jgi:serine/threonine protein kinase